MNAIVGLLALFAALCVMCFLGVALVVLILGTIILVAKVILWLAYLGGIFILLGLAGWGLAWGWEKAKAFFNY